MARARRRWKYRGQQRPEFADTPAPGQESVWDYPRPPRLVPDPRRVRVIAGDAILADTRGALRVLETASPPTFYLPQGDVARDRLCVLPGSSLCEWKGTARYYGLAAGSPPVAWDYPAPFPPFEALRDTLGFYPGRVACFIEDERARPQPGGFYAGWLTGEIIGPCKGAPGSEDW